MKHSQTLLIKNRILPFMTGIFWILILVSIINPYGIKENFLSNPAVQAIIYIGGLFFSALVLLLIISRKKK